MINETFYIEIDDGYVKYRYPLRASSDNSIHSVYIKICEAFGLTPDETKGVMTESLKDKIAISYIKSILKKSLESTDEFDNFECYFGAKLGTCGNISCMHCNVKNIIDIIDSTVHTDDTIID